MNRKKIIKHFIEWYIYNLKQGNNFGLSDVYIENAKVDLLSFLEPYIKDEHYNFSPFKEITE